MSHLWYWLQQIWDEAIMATASLFGRNRLDDWKYAAWRWSQWTKGVGSYEEIEWARRHWLFFFGWGGFAKIIIKVRRKIFYSESE